MKLVVGSSPIFAVGLASTVAISRGTHAGSVEGLSKGRPTNMLS